MLIAAVTPVRSRRRAILRIGLTETADAAHRGQALLKSGEAAIGGAAQRAAAVIGAPWIVLRLSGRALVERGQGTLIQVTGGSARRGNPGRGPWAAAAFATRALVQAQAAELREHNVHAALLIVDAVIESDKTAKWLEDEPPEKSASMEEVAEAVKYLHRQTARGWTHELQLTPSLERWVP